MPTLKAIFCGINVYKLVTEYNFREKSLIKNTKSPGMKVSFPLVGKSLTTSYIFNSKF